MTIVFMSCQSLSQVRTQDMGGMTPRREVRDKPG